MAGIIIEKGGFTPSDIASIWLDADDVAGVDGSNPASLTDRCQGLVFTPEGATGGSLETLGWGGAQKSIKQVDQAWKSSAAAVATVFGSGVSWWVVSVVMLTGFDNHYFSAGNTADATKYLDVKTTVASGSQVFAQRSGAPAETTDQSSELQWYSPQVEMWLCDAAGVHTFYRDGILEQTFTRLPAALTADKLLVGGLVQGGASTVKSSNRWRQWMAGVNAGSTVLNSTNRAKMITWILNNNQGLRWKKGLQGLWTRTYVAVGVQGQSNDQGQGVAPYATVTAPNVYIQKMDSFVTTPLTDPVSSNTRCPYPIFINSGLGSQWPALANALYAQGKYTVSDALIYIPDAISGAAVTTLASGYLSSPPDPSTFIGAVQMRMLEIMRNAPAPKFVTNTWQGETEAASLGAANNWPTFTDRIHSNIDSLMTTWGSVYGAAWLDSNNRHLIAQLPPTGPAPGDGFDFWSTVRANQATYVSSNAGSTLNPIVDGPWTATGVAFLHINEAAQTTQGPLTATLMPTL